MTVFAPAKDQCHATVTPGPHYLHTFNCQYRAKTERDGRPVCGVHARAKQIDFASAPKASDVRGES